ncbi:hypothetical protein G7Y89_g2689 [Cudoniella acicularis]|uniref:peptidyl-tRNA hydrolase n=1 Tax=Cudoniella acicularis TaxID=354080 RepID=A0A8H4W6Q9_9HELO|nr:hypothetical protein G7Y89_g2689 [Cudoniella acicularis]
MASPSQKSETSSSLTKNPTRKQRRKQQRQSPTPTSSNDEQTDDDTITTTSAPAFLSIREITSMATPIRLLVCSIGNPAPYTNTLHSAGHTVLSSLANSLAYPSFQKSSKYGNGMLSEGSEYTLWQSRSLMNVSGAGVSAAWRQFQKESRGEEARLVVVHDELELGVGEVKVRDGGASAKGHNGLKDIAKRLSGQKYMRVAVGIGRPESRDPNVVAGYVLRKMSGTEKSRIEGAVGRVEGELMRLKGL